MIKSKFYKILLLLIPSLISTSSLADKSDEYIKPLQVEQDINSLDLLSGKYYPNLPSLSIPAAPRLSLSTLQQFDSKITGTHYRVELGEVRNEAYSLTYGSKSSEYFECKNYECEGSVNTGSRLLGNMNTQHFIYTQGKSGIKVVYDLKSSYFDHTNDPYSTFYTQGTWYASQIIFPDGETLDIDYDTTTVDVVTYYRPVTVTSDIGYQLKFTYHSNDISTGTSGWSKVSSATIVKSSNPTVALAKYTYSNTAPTQITDLTGRSWSTTGFTNALGGMDYTTAYTLQRPGDSANSVSISAASRNYGSVTHNRFVTQIVRDGQTFNYTYTSPSGSGYDFYKQFSKVVITGPEGYSRTVNLAVSPAPNQHQVISSSVNSLGKTTSYTYTGGLVDVVTYPDGNKVDFDYDAYGNITERREIAKLGSGMADIVTTAYYPVGFCNGFDCYRPEYIIDAKGSRTDYTFDSVHGGMLTKTEPVANSGIRRITTNTYERLNGFYRLTKTSVCAENECGSDKEQVTQFTYWNDTALVKTETITNGTGSGSLVTINTYDDAGRLLIVDGPLAGNNDTTHYRYDSAGRKTWEIGPLNQQGYRVAKRFTYRTQDEQIKKVEIGTLTSATSTNLVVSRVTDKQYDTKGNLSLQTEGSASVTEQVKQFSYDGLNRVSCKTTRMNPLKFTSLPTSACTLGTTGDYGDDRIVKHTYDTVSRLIKTVSGYGTSDAGTDIELGYTSNGQVDWRKDGNGNITDYGYDGFDRLKTTTFPDGSYEQNDYDANGNLTTLRKRDGKILTHAYDAINLRTSTTVPGESSIVFDYDGLGRKKSVVRGTSNVSYSYDVLGRMRTSATNGKTLTYDYDAAGRRSKLTYPDGFYINYYYDYAGALTSIKEYNTKVLVSYVYDSLGRVKTLNRSNGISTSVGYDNVWRVKTFDHSTVNNASFTYNPSSQLVNRVVSNDAYQIKIPTLAEESYVTNELNQYTNINSSALTYDLNGNLKSHSGWSYGFNAHNRLVSASKSGTTLSISYDATGRLESSTLNGSKTTFLYDGDELVAEYSSTGSLLRRYVHGLGNDDPLVWYEGSGTGNSHYLLADEKGSIITETSSSGSVLAQHSYGPYGEPQDVSSSRFRYTGQILLPGTELYYYKARVYNPKLGRFMQTDPIGYEDGMNWYAYVGNDPINMIDPSGKCRSNNGNPSNDCPSEKPDKGDSSEDENEEKEDDIEHVEVKGKRPPTPDLSMMLGGQSSDDQGQESWGDCMVNYPLMPEVTMGLIAPAASLKTPSEFSGKGGLGGGAGKSPFTSIDRRMGRFGNMNAGATVTRGSVGRIKYVGRNGTIAAGMAAFSTGYVVGASVMCAIN